MPRRKKTYDPAMSNKLVPPPAGEAPRRHGAITIEGQNHRFLDFINSKNFAQSLLHKTLDMPIPLAPELGVTLKKWQASGIPRLLAIYHSSVAVDESPAETQSRGLLWYAEAERFISHWGLKVLLLDNHLIPASELDAYDVVICTETFVRLRYVERFRFSSFIDVQALGRLSAKDASKLVKPLNERPNNVLHSRVTGRSISVLIVDESHHYSSENPNLNVTIRSSDYSHCLLPTGTPMYNNWEGIHGQMAALPAGDLFSSVEVFRSIFSQQHTYRDQPTQPLLLTKLLTGLVLGRPPQTVSLRPVIMHIVRFNVRDWSRLRLREAVLVKKALFCMRSSVAMNHGAGAGLAHITRAQMLVNAPVTLQTSPEKLKKHLEYIATINA
ncbi:hypothetical protein NLG97_g7985 [Lecanicillium saksenae]|uniref:Uncharacterized protein n=1 Tax=Lecanicillium saksenae TaxID=468837 RepID=A0ACC1QKA7_9HYPO|nr:hypothetical protein NLG97_g7985 [Lecanicillium saksenae]